MALSSKVITVANTPTLLNNFGQTDGNPGTSLAVYIPSAGQTVFIGGPDVTAANGYPWFAGSEHFIDVDDSSFLVVDKRNLPGEYVYGIVAAGSQPINLLARGV